MRRLIPFVVLLFLLASVSFAVDSVRVQGVLPSYGASHNASAATEVYLKEILTTLLRIEKRLNGGNVLQPVPNHTNAPDGVKLTARLCVTCHQANVADAKGGGFVLVEDDGTLAQLSVEARRRIERRVSNAQMPPAKFLVENKLSPLNAAEKTALLGFIGPVRTTEAK